MDLENISKSKLSYDLLQKALDASSLRSKVIGNNIANINTKDYKRSYVTFEETLKDSIDNIELKRTNPKHISDGNGFGDISVKQDDATSMRSDGNNVDIDAEMSNEAQNTLMYNTLISQINSRLSMERYVISGGGR